MKLLPASLTRAVGRRQLILQKNSPSILFVGGLVGVLGGTALACRATLKVEPALDQIKKDLDDVNATEKVDKNKDVARVYATGGLSLVKLYGPAIICTSAGVVMLTKSHSTLMKRNAAITAAYAVATEAFEAYRVRVREELGEEKEQQLYRGVRMTTIKEGKENTIACQVDVDGLSMYGRIFDEGCRDFKKELSLNLMFLQGQENFANQMLHLKGHVFLNDVYEALGLPVMSYGQVVGWVSNPADMDSPGDGFISFGLEAAKAQALITGDPRLVLDFNVDGVMYDQIDTYQPTHIAHKGW